ncbi:hypothetical protein ACLOJK_015114, partial [Asimina triloba]
WIDGVDGASCGREETQRICWIDRVEESGSLSAAGVGQCDHGWGGGRCSPSLVAPAAGSIAGELGTKEACCRCAYVGEEGATIVGGDGRPGEMGFAFLCI